jgi:hypothetical protein
MTAAGTRRAGRLYWWTAALLLPLINPPAYAALSQILAPLQLDHGAVVALLVAANGALLWGLSGRAWAGVAQRNRVLAGVAVAIVSSLVAAVLEVVVLVVIVCSHAACFD